MALAKDRAPPCPFYGSYVLEAASPSPIQFPSLSINPSTAFYPFEEDHYKKQISLQGDHDTSTNNNIGNTHQVHVSHSPPLSSSSSATSSNGIAFHGVGSRYHRPEDANSLINFNKATATTNSGGFMYTANGSFLSFQPQHCYSFGQPTEYPFWEASSPYLDHHSHQNQLMMNRTVVGGGDFRVLEEANCLQTTSGGHHDAASEWLYGEGAAVARHSAQESATVLQQTSINKKRPLMEEENMQTLKKQCNSTRKQPNKPKPSNATKDPQSIAAKNRRERISERLKILQDLVPNGSKVDMVTMLEKAISYVKFLQLQVKVLATDEFWPAGGGKLPDITQVRNAIDAILSTQSDKPSTSEYVN